MTEELIIIGSGPAGLTAALYTAREGFNPMVISGINEGGQLILTTVIENYPGFPEGVMGPDLISLMKKQAEKFGARFASEEVESVDFSARPFKIKTNARDYEAKCVIVATGASANWLGIPSEKKFIGKGVSSCATCDGPFFKKKNVVVIGGGDTALTDSLVLTMFADSVTIVHRRDKFRASRIMQDRVLSNKKIKVVWNSTVEEILGDARVNGVNIKNTVTNEVTMMPIDGVFVAIGYSPNTKFLEGQLKLDEKGYVITKGEIKTDIEGVFVAGDAADPIYRQAVSAAGSGAKAAVEAREYLQMLEYSDKPK
jgi:thioredoxin reductase (NADPH)